MPYGFLGGHKIDTVQYIRYTGDSVFGPQQNESLCEREMRSDVVKNKCHCLSCRLKGSFANCSFLRSIIYSWAHGSYENVR